jgi:hypothetical protein
LDSRLTRIEAKLDAMMVQLPRFVTWQKLAGAAVTIATLIIAVVNLVL